MVSGKRMVIRVSIENATKILQAHFENLYGQEIDLDWMPHELNCLRSNYPKIITRDYLRANPDTVFVYGDNIKRFGKGGAAKLRDEPNTYGFITKKYPSNSDSSFYRLDEYRDVFISELAKLKQEIIDNPDLTYLISALGQGLANRYRIFECVISLSLKKELLFENVVFLW